MDRETYIKALGILDQRFGRDSLMALATCADNLPYVRTVDAYYMDGAIYVITYALSGKMQQIAKNPEVALAGDWFTARGTAENIGWFCLEKNADMAKRLREAFAAWIDNGHNNFDDENTIILKINLKTGVLYADGVRYEIDFTA